MIATDVASGGVRLRAYARAGTGPTVLLAHSIGCDARLWDGVIAALPAAYRLIAWDMRGHGASAAPVGDYAVATLAGDALAVLDAFGVTRAHLCGLSLGGTVAQWLALHRPERLASITLADTAARLGTIDGWSGRAMTALGVDGMAGLAEMSLARFFSPAFAARRPDVVAGFRQTFLATPAQGFAGCCAALRDADTRGDLARIAVPTLVICGADDVPTPVSDSQALAQGIPGATLAILPTGHLSAVEAPEGFAGALLRHIEASSRAGR